MINIYYLCVLLLISCAVDHSNGSNMFNCDFIEGLDNIDDITCGKISVPENHDDPANRHIDITFVVLKAIDKNGKQDPLIYFSGGPGGASLTAGRIKQWLDNPIRQQRDIILFDQRGIGYSSALPNMEKELFEIMFQDADAEKEQELMDSLLDKYKKICLEQNIGLEHYNSFQNGRDVGVLMKHLGYQKYNLYGVSYGTRLARIVQDMFPEMLNTVIHNSPAPLVGDFLLGRLESYSLALGRLFEYCDKDEKCRIKYPNLRSDYLSAITALIDNPIRTEIRGRTFIVNAQDAVYLLRRKLYSNDARDKIPELIKTYIQGGGPIVDDIINTETLFSNSYNSTMWLSVERYEMFNPENTPDVIEQHYQRFPLLPVKLGIFNSFYNAGRSWHNAILPENEKEFELSSVPTLITVNQYDPVTPPENGHIFQSKMSNSKFFILDEGGHGGGNAECRTKLMIAFMDNPQGELDTSCLNIYRG